MGITTTPQHRLVIELNGSEMKRVWDAAREEGLSMEAWAAAVVAIAAAEVAQRLKAARVAEVDSEGGR